MAIEHRSDPRLIDLTGRRFGKWTVIDRCRERKTSTWWNCRCDCGNVSTVSSGSLIRAKSRSCGCATATQGWLSTTREYSIWSAMLRRCYRLENDNYRFYGSKGTSVCRRWRDSLVAFIEDMGLAPSRQHTLDRINTHGHYTCGKCEECKANDAPANCRWATKAEQVRNQASNRYYTHDGKTLILKDWARLSGINYLTLWNRLNVGMAFADAISIKRYDRKAITRAKPR